MRDIIVSVLAALAIFIAVQVAHANEGTGTAGFCERHGCGAPEDPTEVKPCVDPAPSVCPDVTCQATDCSKTVVTVNPTPCPEVTFPNYVPCRRKNDGTLKCPRAKTPRRVLTPQGK